jgi:hypothetical protein
VYFHLSLRNSRNWTYRVNRSSSGIRVLSTLTLGVKGGKSGGVITERYHPRKSKVITTKYWTADRNRLKLTAYRGSLGAARGAYVPSNPIHASTKRDQGDGSFTSRRRLRFSSSRFPLLLTLKAVRDSTPGIRVSKFSSRESLPRSRDGLRSLSARALRSASRTRKRRSPEWLLEPSSLFSLRTP